MKNLIHLNKAQTKHLLEDKAEVASPLRVQVDGDASPFWPRCASPRCPRLGAILYRLTQHKDFEAYYLRWLPSQKGRPMFTAEEYRAKAIEYSKLGRIASGPDELREFERLERSFAEPGGQCAMGNRDSGPDDARQRARSRTVQAGRGINNAWPNQRAPQAQKFF